MQATNNEPAINDDYLIKEAQKLRNTDPAAAKAWILTAKTLYPSAFSVQYEAYKLEKEADNYEEAAKCFSLLATNFPHQHTDLWHEIDALTRALRVSPHEATLEQEFFMKMYKHLGAEVQHQVLIHTVNHSDNPLEQCKLLILMLNKFPKAAASHAPRLLEMIVDGIKNDAPTYQKMLVDETLPLLHAQPPEVTPVLACRLYTISLEYYLRLIITDESNRDSSETWKMIFKILTLCGKMQRWEAFLPFNKSWGRNVYWEKLAEIVYASPAGSPQVLFYAATLFIYSLHGYIKNCIVRIDDTDVSHVLVEGFTEWKVENNEAPSMEPPQFSLTTSVSQELSKAFLHAAQCWQLLNTEQFQREFSNLMLALPLAPWISRFLFDLAIYFGHRDEAKKLMSEMSAHNALVHSLQILSLNLLQGTLTLQGFQCILKIVSELPSAQGQFLEHLSVKEQRHMIFLPLTQRALMQYCTRAVINTLSRKLYEPNCKDQIMGDLLVLLQLDYPRETLMAEQIFALINSRRSFTYRLFCNYMICIDFLEEFAFIWHSHSDDCNFDLAQTASPTSGSQRRMGTRGADKGARDDFRAILKQQVARANESITTVVANFISQEHLMLAQNIFGNSIEVVIMK